VPLADLEKRREYDRERKRLYYQANREKRIAAAKAWQAANPEKVKATRKRYRGRATELQREYDAKPGARQSKQERDRAWRQANPDAAWGHSLKKAHAMRPEQWYAMWMEQGGNCYLCLRPLPDDRAKVAVDHDHEHCPEGRSCAICRRGLTHHGCNTGIGSFGDDPAIMRVVADNLERAKELTAALLLVAPQQDKLFAD
jgi:Recombination endonuclease VII